LTRQAKQLVLTWAAISIVTALTSHGGILGIDGIQPIPIEEIPKSGTFWLEGGPEDSPFPPLPIPPVGDDFAVFDLGNGQFLVDDSNVDLGSLQIMAREMTSQSAPPSPPGGGGGQPYTPPPDIPNAEKYAAQRFSVIDLNEAASNNASLYAICTSFPADNNTDPYLQIARYGSDAVIVKASHFDFSAEERDFALLICDKVNTPLWRDVNLMSPGNSQDGWLIQGIVKNWQVTDPMFLLVSNLNLSYNGFFRAIPYSGPEVTISSPEPYSVVANSISLSVGVRDLSGTTSLKSKILINGLEGRASISGNNSVTIDTRYAPLGVATVKINVQNDNATVLSPQTSEGDVKLIYDGSAELPLIFANSLSLSAASDLCTTDVGTNYIWFYLDAPQQVQAVVFSPSDGRIIQSNSWYASAGDVAVGWNFTDSNGTTAYSADSYGIRFSGSTSGTLQFTNSIDRVGVRPAGGVIIHYQHEKPGWIGAGTWYNGQADTYMQALEALYESIYSGSFGSLTQYEPWQIGSNRRNPVAGSIWPLPFALNTTSQNNWPTFLHDTLVNRLYSDFDYGSGHGGSDRIGGISVGVTVSALEVGTWAQAGASGPNGNKNWRLRKVAMWSCYSGNLPIDATYVVWTNAFGIRSASAQLHSFMYKNVGLFFKGELPLAGYGGPSGTSAMVAATLDHIWVTGPLPFPGGCDPTYAFSWAFAQTAGMYPALNLGEPVGLGHPYLPYTGIYDQNLMQNDYSSIHTQ